MIIDTTLVNVESEYLALLVILMDKYGDEDEQGNKYVSLSFEDSQRVFSKNPNLYIDDDKQNKVTHYKLEYGTKLEYGKS